MSDNQEKMEQRKQILLSELESIKDLLNDQKADNIPILKDAIVEDSVDTDDLYEEENIEIDLDQIDEVNEEPSTPGVLPGQQSLFSEGNKESSKQNKKDDLGVQAEEADLSIKDKQSPKKSLQNNPFLPPHIRERLGQDMTEVPVEKAQPASPLLSPSYTEQLIEQLVAQHLPKIEAELRQRLAAVVKLHNERTKK